MKTFLVCLLLTLVARAEVPSPRFTDLYDDALLNKWQASFEEDITWNYKNVILPKLTRAEKAKLDNVKILFPLKGAGQEPFEFYAANGSVFIPVLSLRFFADLMLATAWLERSGYTSETVQQYVGMLRYSDKSTFKGGIFPRPLDALGIPANVRDDKRVMQTFNNAYSSAMIFLLCHELGHVVHNHPGYIGVDTADTRANEAQADSFALEVMRRIGVVPAGAMFWFVNLTRFEQHRSDVSSDKEWKKVLDARTHPLTSDRLERLAALMEKSAPDFARTQSDTAKGLLLVRSIAAQIRVVSQTLTNQGIHRLYREQALTTKPEMLAPRRTLAYEAVAASGGKFDELPFNGEFVCTLASGVNKQSIDQKMLLSRNSNKVVGEYSHATISGRIAGTVDGKTLNLDWFEGRAAGKGAFIWNDADKSFTGTWGDRQSRTDGGSWDGKRK